VAAAAIFVALRVAGPFCFLLGKGSTAFNKELGASFRLKEFFFLTSLLVESIDCFVFLVQGGSEWSKLTVGTEGYINI
jgi:hypothetical protein